MKPSVLIAAVITTFGIGAAHAIQIEERLIKDGDESFNAGVPNYAQNTFDGDHDCGPTAAAMLIGYYDANGWPCMVPGSGPYVAFYGEDPPTGVVNLVTDLQNEMPWSNCCGTPASEGLDYNGKAVVRVAGWRDPGADWDYDEDETPAKNDIKSQINVNQPVLLLVRAFGSDYVWFNDPHNPDGAKDSVDWHWMTILGYTHFIFDNDDELFLQMRSGWRSGSDSRLAYHYGFWDDLYTVEIFPYGSAACEDPEDFDGDGHATKYPQPGMTGGDDCDDGDASVHPGAPEICDDLDNNCNGDIDESAPGVSDKDGDGVADLCDVCPDHYDPDQTDTDDDGAGDACDPDDDNDGCLDRVDEDPLNDRQKTGYFIAINCSQTSGETSGWAGVDSDGDGDPDCQDPDNDDDGFLDEQDECPTTAGSGPRQLQCTDYHTCPFQTPIDPCLIGGCDELVDQLNQVVNPVLKQLEEILNSGDPGSLVPELPAGPSFDAQTSQ